ncbi:MAG: hypothetical protein JSS93_02880 [Bacteroidetes bacterium]|nr:hypothetical protein [Bacteroidota bacterium]
MTSRNKYKGLAIFILASTLIFITLTIKPDLFGCRFENQGLLFAGLFATPLLVWVYDRIKKWDGDREYSFLADRFERTLIKELKNGQYVDLNDGLREQIELIQKGRKFEGAIKYPEGVVTVTLEIDAENKYLGKGIYKYKDKLDFGFYEILIDRETEDTIYIKYKNRISSNPADSEKVEGIEIWTRKKN